MYKHQWALFLLLSVAGCFEETPVQVVADFDVEVMNMDYSVPVTLHLKNKSLGADLYEWTFQGGTPQKSNKMNPKEIVYEKAGTYVIRLEAWNTTERKEKEFVIELDSAISAGFDYEVLVNDYAPVEILFTNKGIGGNRYRWEFEGGEPSFSEKQSPSVVIFREPGKHGVRLQVFNNREVVEYWDTITVLPELSVDFEYRPVTEDPVCEAPCRLQLTAHCVSALFYKWIIDGGDVDNDTLPETEVCFTKGGNYRIILEAGNGKSTKRISKYITIQENTNLLILKDIKFGITTANNVGYFFSSVLKRVLLPDELNVQTGPEIDLLFWGLGENFERCCFISPDSAEVKAFPYIPGARHTWTINRPEIFTPEQFDRMENDLLLKEIEIKNRSDKNVTTYFNSGMPMHVVLFETEDGRKGAVKIKDFVNRGRQSYLLTDIKIQKAKNRI